MRYYILALVNYHQQADLFSYHNYNNRLRLANQKPNINYIISQKNVWNVEIANLIAKTYTLYTVYGLETLGIHLYSPLLSWKVLNKFETRPKIWLEDL